MGFGSCCNHHVKLGRGVSQQVRYRAINFVIGYTVVIIQEQIDVIVNVGQIVDPSGNNRVKRHQRIVRNQIDCRFTNAIARAPQCMRHIVKEPRRLVAVSVEGEPSDDPATLLESLSPSDCQGSLAETRTRCDHSDLLRLHLSDQVQQPGPVDQARRTLRRQNFGSEKLCFTGSDHLVTGNRCGTFSSRTGPRSTSPES